MCQRSGRLSALRRERLVYRVCKCQKEPGDTLAVAPPCRIHPLRGRRVALTSATAIRGDSRGRRRWGDRSEL